MIVVKNQFVQRPGPLDLLMKKGDDWWMDIQIMQNDGITPYDLSTDPITAVILDAPGGTIVHSITITPINLLLAQLTLSLARTVTPLIEVMFWEFRWEHQSKYRCLIAGSVEAIT